MCKVYNTIGSLTAIKSHLHRHNITEFTSLKEVMNFQKNYNAASRKIISDHELIVTQEMVRLNSEIQQLTNIIQSKKIELEEQLRSEIQDLKHKLERLSAKRSNFVQKLAGYFTRRALQKKIISIEYDIESNVAHSVQHLTDVLADKAARHKYFSSHFHSAARQSAALPMKELERKKKIIDEINTSIYGALGEQKVVKELEKLSEDYILINDFNCSFSPSIYYKQEDQYIKSIQIDHLLISPAAIFLIETKNWSASSLSNLDLRSPVEQIRRTNFALFKLLAGKASAVDLGLNGHHWGPKKIPIKNLIILVNKKPKQEFQFAKVLTLTELISYIEYFPPVFSADEREKIAHRLLDLNGQQRRNG